MSRNSAKITDNFIKLSEKKFKIGEFNCVKPTIGIGHRQFYYRPIADNDR